MKTGRKAVVTDTRPGQVLAFALLANAPIAFGFVLAPLLTGGNPATGRAAIPVVVFATPVFALASLVVFFRAPPERRMHRAARIGLVLALTATLLWVLVLLLWLRQ